MAIFRILFSIPLAVLGAAMLFSATALAQEEAGRFYVGGGVGLAKSKDGCRVPAGVVYTACEDTSVSFEAFIGYRLTDSFAAEFGGLIANDFEQVGTVGGEGFNFQTEAETYFLGGAARFPVATDTYLYAKAGMHFWEASTGLGPATKLVADGTDPYFGIGVQHMISDRLGLDVGFTKYSVDDELLAVDNIDVLAARLMYLL